MDDNIPYIYQETLVKEKLNKFKIGVSLPQFK